MMDPCEHSASAHAVESTPPVAAPGNPARAREAGVDFEREVFCLLGMPIDAVDMHAAVQRVRAAALSHTRCFVSTPNLNFAMAARSDAAFRGSLQRSDLCLADGMPLVWLARLLGLPIRERVSGAGLFERLQAHTGPALSVFFFGGPDGAAAAACKRVNERGGGLRCVGFDAPGFGSIEQMSEDQRIARINASGAQFVVVALGAKKGQAWIEHNRARLCAPVLCHLGAVVNFAAGTLRRAPVWLQTLGAEWLWRIWQEPGLWRRYWGDGLGLLRVLVRHTLPLAAPWRRPCWARQAAPRATLSLLQTPGQTTLEMRGAWTHAELAPLRRALAQALDRPGHLVLQLASVTHVDSALLGLLLLAHGAVGGTRHLSVCNASPRVAAIFEHSGAAFLLEQRSRKTG